MAGHVPVLLQEAISWLNIQPAGVYLDCTLGGGGHTREILQRLGSQGRIIALDQDRRIMEATQKSLSAFAPQITFYSGNFRHLRKILDQLGVQQVQGILFDLGVSSFQLDEGERGFSYHQDAPLDMRMDPKQSVSAYALVNQSSLEELSQMIWAYGEERWASRIAEFIVANRQIKPIQTTGELVEVIKQAVPAGVRWKGPHPARRTFQALRIAVNDELGALTEALMQGIQSLAPQGRMVVISFHSLEDRIVKDTFKRAVQPCVCPVDFPVCQCGKKPLVRLLTRKPILPSNEEISHNQRARSAKLRAVEKLLVTNPE